MSVQTEQENFSFQAEVVQILDLVVHSLYSNKEIFLRELISNASDALDRLRFETFSHPEMAEDESSKPSIRVSFNTSAATVTIADNGIGMSREEVISNIGTIAKSGTREFLQSISGDGREDAAMIGQFGVGFYSAFIVAERVVLITRRAGLPACEGVRWESDGKGEYTLEAVECATPGTTIVLHLRDSEEDLLSDFRLRTIIQKYSDHISLPIILQEEKTGTEPDAKPDSADAPVNQASAFWVRPKNEISDREYKDFYRHATGDYSDPLTWVHSKIEGKYEYSLLLFIPARSPYDLYIPEYRRGVKLHVHRVFIMEDTGQLLPSYVRFVRGVIDSSDLPLNISRELLQGSRVVDSIRTSVVKKVLKLLAELAESDPGKYATFWNEFGEVLKEGIPDDYSNRDEIAKLLRFTSTKSAGQPDVSLGDYVARMKDGQEHIYYLIAPTVAAATASPHLEAFRQKGVEVLLLGDAVDNWVVTSLREFQGKRLQSVAEGASDLSVLDDEAEKVAKEKASSEFAVLCDKLKTILAEQVHDVRVTSRLTTSPACIVSSGPDSDFDPSVRLQRSGLPTQPVLEINPGHIMIERLNHEPDEHLADWAHVLYNQAVLTIGARLQDPAAFVSRLNGLLVALGGPSAPDAVDGEPLADE
jgi:molecular chaperone HtpG